jgi:hypothetical protein
VLRSGVNLRGARADGRRKGVPKAVTVTDNTILRAENGIPTDAGKDIEVADNVLKGIGDTELRITAGVRR